MGREPAVPAAGLRASGISVAYLEGGRPEKLGPDPEGGRGVWGHDTGADGGMVLQEYGDRKEELSFRCLFAESMDKEADGVCMAWTEVGTDGSLIPSLHWLAVRDTKKGQGIGTALVREALRIFAGRGEIPVFLHTQPWSYEAVGLYLKAGFFLCRSETFGTHKNQFQEGIRILEQYLDVDPRLCR